MKKTRILLCAAAFFIHSFAFCAPQVQAGDSVRLYTPVSLRSAPSFDDSAVLYTPILHEGGLKLCIQTVEKQEVIGSISGAWCTVRVLLGFWNESDSAWVDSGGSYWIFLPDDARLYFLN